MRSSSGYESSGLGLAFCRLAVEAQGGAIRIEDAVPRGSTFVVELPR
jgi:two-component system, sensor histidine kinase and response regulator